MHVKTKLQQATLLSLGKAFALNLGPFTVHFMIGIVFLVGREWKSYF
jgi:hypothetical protein